MAPALDASEAVAVVGLGFGDEGKGSIVDALARRLGARRACRFNGGPQAAHHVVTDGGVTHCFAQFTSLMLAAPGAQSHSGPRVLVEPLALQREAQALERAGVSSPLERLRLDERCVVVTPFHRLMNRALEASRGQQRHGSCGLGVGQAYTDALDPHAPTVRLAELRDPQKLARKLDLLRLLKLDLVEQLEAPPPEVVAQLRRRDIVEATLEGYRSLPDAAIAAPGEADEPPQGPLLLEGAQGVLLDEHHGLWPHVTPSTTTFAWAEELHPAPFRLGLLRAFSTRHGAGPFVAEGAPVELLRGEHNALNPWQGSFRVGWFDLLMARHALAIVGGVDGLALTCLDRLASLPEARVVAAYRYHGPADEVADLLALDGDRVVEIFSTPSPTRERQARLARALARCAPVLEPAPSQPSAFVDRIEHALGVPVVLTSSGPTASAKQPRP